MASCSPAYLLYNCRCTLIAAVDGVDTSDAKRWARTPEAGDRKLVSDMSYQKWAGWKSKQKLVASDEKTAIMREKAENGGALVQTIGKIDVEKYRCGSESIRTSEVIITDEHIGHIVGYKNSVITFLKVEENATGDTCERKNSLQI